MWAMGFGVWSEAEQGTLGAWNAVAAIGAVLSRSARYAVLAGLAWVAGCAVLAGGPDLAGGARFACEAYNTLGRSTTCRSIKTARDGLPTAVIFVRKVCANRRESEARSHRPNPTGLAGLDGLACQRNLQG